MAQMPEEGRMFQQVDRTWHEVMGFTQKDTNVLVATSMPNLLEKLRDAVALLARVQSIFDKAEIHSSIPALLPLLQT